MLVVVAILLEDVPMQWQRRSVIQRPHTYRMSCVKRRVVRVVKTRRVRHVLYSLTIVLHVHRSFSVNMNAMNHVVRINFYNYLCEIFLFSFCVLSKDHVVEEINVKMINLNHNVMLMMLFQLVLVKKLVVNREIKQYIVKVKCFSNNRCLL